MLAVFLKKIFSQLIVNNNRNAYILLQIHVNNNHNDIILPQLIVNNKRNDKIFEQVTVNNNRNYIFSNNNCNLQPLRPNSPKSNYK